MGGIADILAYGAAVLAVVSMAATSIRRMRYALLATGLAAIGFFILADRYVWAFMALIFDSASPLPPETMG